MGSDRSEIVAGRLLAGVMALREGRNADAAQELALVAADPELAAADDLVDIRARSLTLLAQALLAAGRHREATPWLDAAERLLAQLRDRDGLAEVGRLRDAVRVAEVDAIKRRQIAASLESVARTPVERIRERATTPESLADLLIQKVNAEIEAGRPSVAEGVACEALEAASRSGSPRAEVLARLSLARAAPDRAGEQILAALDRADRAGDHNLVTAVAQAASLHGVTLPLHHGPHERVAR